MCEFDGCYGVVVVRVMKSKATDDLLASEQKCLARAGGCGVRL
jgi:hypothetical protein